MIYREKNSSLYAAQAGNLPSLRHVSNSPLRRAAASAAIAPTPARVHFIPNFFLHRDDTDQSLNFSIFVFAIHSLLRNLER